MTTDPVRPTHCWRIDDLAHRGGVTVDTVRYYQREGLVPEGERAGRVKLYGPHHLERLERIRDLQGRGFSLAAIRSLLEGNRQHLVEGIFADRGERRAYALEELVERSGIDRGLCTALRDAGLLRDPAEYGRDAYDDEDLELLRSMAELAPYNVVVVALEEDPTIRMVGNLVEDARGSINAIDPATIRIGEPVRGVFAPVEDVALPRWVRAGDNTRPDPGGKGRAQ